MSDFSEFILNIPPKSISVVATIFGLILVDDLNASELDLLGNFLMLIGQILVMEGSRGHFISTIQINNRIENLQEELCKLRMEIERMKYIK